MYGLEDGLDGEREDRGWLTAVLVRPKGRSDFRRGGGSSQCGAPELPRRDKGRGR